MVSPAKRRKLKISEAKETQAESKETECMEDENKKREDFAKLKVHGDFFMASLGLTSTIDFEGTNRPKKTSSFNSQSIEALKNKEKKIADKKTIKDYNKFDSEPKVGLEVRSEEGEDQFAAVEYEKHTLPEVVVFDDASFRKDRASTSTNVYGWRAFLSSKVSKIDYIANKSTIVTNELEEEKLNQRHDAELEELLRTTKLLERYTAEQLSGKDLRKHKQNQMVALGAKPPKNDKIPTPIGLGLLNKKRERDSKELQEAKNLGLYHHSIKDNWAASAKKKTINRDRGIGLGIGKIKEGILTLSSQDIKRVEMSSRKKALNRHGFCISISDPSFFDKQLCSLIYGSHSLQENIQNSCALKTLIFDILDQRIISKRLISVAKSHYKLIILLVHGKMLHPRNSEFFQSWKEKLCRHQKYFQCGQAVVELSGVDDEAYKKFPLQVKYLIPYCPQSFIYGKPQIHKKYFLIKGVTSNFVEGKKEEPIFISLKKMETKSDQGQILDESLPNKRQQSQRASELQKLAGIVNSKIAKTSGDYIDFLQEIGSLMKMPYVEVQIMFETIDFTLMREEVFDSFLQELIKGEDLAYQNQILLIKAAFFKKVFNLTATPSRNFLGTILNIAKANGKPMINGLLLPLLRSVVEIGRPQLDVIIRIINEALTDANVLFFLQEFFRHSTFGSSGNPIPFTSDGAASSSSTFSNSSEEIWSDSTIEIFVAIFNKKFHLDDQETLQKFLSSLNYNIESKPENKKLAQVIMLLITKHGNIIIDELDFIKVIAAVESLSNYDYSKGSGSTFFN
ncbi:hypothetical protein G9A89_005069 [Geosiphon pyriformis]|nr:hypothetical protein G9A89_005069 [Geosiphon pyriformis]